MEECYKEIPNFKGYEVSNMGSIKSYRVNKKGTILKTIIGSRGYPLINLMQEGKMFQFSVHRLVAENFIDNPKKLPFVNHIDLDKTNNNVSNLEWVSGRENVTHYYNSISTSSKYTGVYNQNGKFNVQIHINKDRLSLGSYNSEEEARDVYIEGLRIFNELGIDAILEYKSQVENKYSSKFKCVSFDKSRDKWTGSVFHNGKKIFGKRYDTEYLAVDAVIKTYLENNIPLHYSHKKYLEEIKESIQ